jgi:hypothetical protein
MPDTAERTRSRPRPTMTRPELDDSSLTLPTGSRGGVTLPSGKKAWLPALPLSNTPSASMEILPWYRLRPETP